VGSSLVQPLTVPKHLIAGRGSRAV
jgi:hypothetical protein